MGVAGEDVAVARGLGRGTRRHLGVEPVVAADRDEVSRADDPGASQHGRVGRVADDHRAYAARRARTGTRLGHLDHHHRLAGLAQLPRDGQAAIAEPADDDVAATVAGPYRRDPVTEQLGEGAQRRDAEPERRQEPGDVECPVHAAGEYRPRLPDEQLQREIDENRSA